MLPASCARPARCPRRRLVSGPLDDALTRTVSRGASATFPIARVRNIGIMAHIDAGKTTTTERILFYAGAISRLGEVDDGGAFTDWMEQEQERGISITSASTTFAWRDAQVNLIDTPGHVDFTIEVERSLRVLDGAIAVFSAIEGVQAQSEAVWRQADRYHVPRLAFINKCDRVGADPDAVVLALRTRLAARPLVLHLPIGLGDDFAGVVDLVAMTARTWDEASLGVRFDDAAIPADLADTAALAREAMIDALAELDDRFLAEYLDAADTGAALAPVAIHAAIRRVTLAGAAVPVVLGAAFRNKGVHNLLDAVVDYLPSPLDRPPVVGVVPLGVVASGGGTTTRAPDPSGPLAALAWKVMADGDRGQITYVRIYAGTLAAGQTVYNATKARLERIDRLVRMHANRREDVDALPAGAIGAIVAAAGERTATTGDTLCDPTAPLCLDPVHVPEPVIGITVEPATLADDARLRVALERLAAEDPSFRVGVDLESGATTIAGMGELHLEIIVDRLRREFGVDARVGRLQVAYRETVTARGRGEAVHATPSRLPVDHGHVILVVEPAGRGRGFQFENQAASADVPAELVPAVAEAAAEAASIGVVAGFPMTDLTVSLVGGSHHVVDSSPRGYKLATTRAFRDAAVAAAPTILEPVMELEVRAPDEHTGDVLGELLSRRAKISGMEARPGVQVIAAAVPLAEMVGYASVLRSSSRGRGTYSMRFAHYAEVPQATRARLAARAHA